MSHTFQILAGSCGRTGDVWEIQAPQVKGFCGAEGRSRSCGNSCVVTTVSIPDDFLPCSRQCRVLTIILACVELVCFHSNISVLSSQTLS